MLPRPIFALSCRIKSIRCQYGHPSRIERHSDPTPHIPMDHTFIIHKEKGRRNRQFSARLASVGVCFRSCMYASVIRSVCDRLQLLTIHSFMNHEFILALQNTQGSVSSISVPSSSKVMHATPAARTRTKRRYCIIDMAHGSRVLAWSCGRGSPISSAIPNTSFCQKKKSSRSVLRRRETC